MRRWLVTGASGFLGANTGLWLDGRAHRIGLARSAVPAAAFDEVHAVDLLDRPSIAALVRSSRPDVIVHCAALASHEACSADPRLAQQVNVDATRAIAEAAHEVGASLVYISTDSVFSGARGGYRESDEPEPFSVYGMTKLGGEVAVGESAADALIVRTNFFGWSPSGTRSILEFFVDALRCGRAVPGYTDFEVTSIYARHLVGIIERLVLSEHRGVVHVASVDKQSKYAFGQLVASGFSLPGALITPVSAPLDDPSASRARDLSLNTSRLTGWLGTPPPSQHAGVRAAYDDESVTAGILRDR